MSAETQMSEDFHHSILRRLHALLAGQSKRMFEYLCDAHIAAVAQPFADGCFPGIDDEARSLFGGGQCFEFRRFLPPRRTRRVLLHGFGPELVANLFQTVTVDHAAASDWPEPSRSGWIF